MPGGPCDKLRKTKEKSSQHPAVRGRQRRGLGLGPPLDTAEQEVWAERAVDLFLDGVSVSQGRAPKAEGT